MVRRRGILPIVVACVVVARDANADKPEVAALVLPSRVPVGEADMSARAAGVAARLAARIHKTAGAIAPTDGTSIDVTGLLVGAQPLVDAGRLDEASNILDIALDAGARRPSLVTDR